MILTSSELEQLRAAAFAHCESVAKLAERICAVVASLLRERGYTPDIDTVGNVYARRRGKKEYAPLLMLMAHTDTVFPIETPIVIRRDGDILRGPGIGDNSLGVAAMLSALELLDHLGWETAADIVAVADVGEEGLGNLRGARAAVERYRTELGAVLVIDGRFSNIVNVAVGSQRWRITVRGPGGHSFGSFGTPSAIHGLGKIIAALHVPHEPKTTFNVGIIEGGTSVNTIAATATAILDLRSTDDGALKQLVEQARHAIMDSAGPDLQVEIEVLGERPSGKRARTDPLIQLADQTIRWLLQYPHTDRRKREKPVPLPMPADTSDSSTTILNTSSDFALGIEPKYIASSTDANIPISLGIPSVCIGITHGEKAHTLDEYINVPIIGQGLAQLVSLCIDACSLITQ